MSEFALVAIWPELVVPTLRILADGQPRQRRDIFALVALEEQISDDARAERLKSGGARFDQRMGWALSHLTKARWVTRPERGHYLITTSGVQALSEHSNGLTMRSQKQVVGAFRPKASKATVRGPIPELADDIADSIEMIEEAVARIEDNVGQELLTRLRSSHPDFFERAVVDLLLKMG